MTNSQWIYLLKNQFFTVSISDLYGKNPICWLIDSHLFIISYFVPYWLVFLLFSRLIDCYLFNYGSLNMSKYLNLFWGQLRKINWSDWLPEFSPDQNLLLYKQPFSHFSKTTWDSSILTLTRKKNNKKYCDFLARLGLLKVLLSRLILVATTCCYLLL